MSGLGGFLFGNIDEEGRLDDEDLDEELRANLSNFAEKMHGRKLLPGLEAMVGAEALQDAPADEQPGRDASSTQPQLQQSTGQAVTPLPTATDFENIQELAEVDADAPPEEQPVRGPARTAQVPAPAPAVASVAVDPRVLLRYTKLASAPALLNGTGRPHGRYGALKRLRLRRRQLLHRHWAPLENQAEGFVRLAGPSHAAPAGAASRLRLSLVNLGTGTGAVPVAGRGRARPASQRFRLLEKQLAQLSLHSPADAPLPSLHSPADAPLPPHPNTPLPEAAHHPLNLLPWDEAVLWATPPPSEPEDAPAALFVSLQGGTPPGPGSAPLARPPSTAPPAHSSALSSILSSLSLSTSGTASASASAPSLSGADAATATALLTLIRNQQLQRSSSATVAPMPSAPPLPGPPRVPPRAHVAPPASLRYPRAAAARVRNRWLEPHVAGADDWAAGVIWDPCDAPDHHLPALLNTRLTLPLDDPLLIFTPVPEDNLNRRLNRAEKMIAKRLRRLRSDGVSGAGVSGAGVNGATATANGTIAAPLTPSTTTPSNTHSLTSFARPISDRFNLSNDKYYEPVSLASAGPHASSTAPGSEQRADARTDDPRDASPASFSLSALPRIQHALPALKLLPPAFPTCRTKRELRLWHRPRLAFLCEDTPLPVRPLWLPVRAGSHAPGGVAATDRDAHGPLSFRLGVTPAPGIVRSLKKLTLRDASRFLLLEYAEEFPPMLLNAGMGACVVLYYRKRAPNDPFVPHSTTATVQLLDFTDPSPFWIFGDVQPGSTRLALVTALFRAPLFPHAASPCDFVCARRPQLSDGEGASGSGSGTAHIVEYYLRPIDHGTVYTVGQLLPCAEVPGPHSRRHNLFCRARLQVAAYRLFGRDTGSTGSTGNTGNTRNTTSTTSTPSTNTRRRLKIARLLSAFPQFSEGSIRKWLKEYAESTRAGKDAGIWALRADAPQLSEDDLRGLVAPEAACQYEAMMAEQQRTADAELLFFDPFSAAPPPEDAPSDDDASSVASARGPRRRAPPRGLPGLMARTAPWATTANVLGAVQGRVSLQLRGLGDPSGRGQGFSLARAPAAHGALGEKRPQPASSAADYRQDLSRIWEAQHRALSARGVSVGVGPGTSTNTSASANANASTSATITPPNAFPSPFPALARIPEGARLVIRRRTGPEAPVAEEVVLDRRLIAAYLKGCVQTPAAALAEKKGRRGFVAPDALSLLQTPAAADFCLRDRKLAARKKAAVAAGATGGATGALASTIAAATLPPKAVTLRCGACGLVGHMRTNRVCPLFGSAPAELDPLEAASAAPTPPSAHPPLTLKLSFAPSHDHPAPTTTATPIAPASSSSGSDDSIYRATVRGPPRAPGPPLPPLFTKAPARRPRALTPKQRHHAFLASLPPPLRAHLAALSSLLVPLIDAAIALPTSLAFHKPVSRRLYPRYYLLVPRPIDLASIRAKALALHYRHADQLCADFALMAANCDAFNGPDSPLSLVAHDMLRRTRDALAALLPHLQPLHDALAALPSPDDALDVNILSEHEHEGEGENAAENEIDNDIESQIEHDIEHGHEPDHGQDHGHNETINAPSHSDAALVK